MTTYSWYGTGMKKEEGPPDRALDVEELERCLAQLIAGYRDALKFVERQPFRVGWRMVSTVDQKLGERIDAGELHRRAQTAKPKNPLSITIFGRFRFSIFLPPFLDPGKRLIITPIVRLFVETHTRARLESILRQLRIEQMTLPGEDDPEQKQLTYMVNQINQALQFLFRWGRLGNRFATSPVLSAVLAFLTPILLAWVGVNLSSVSALGEWVAQLIQSGEGVILVSLLRTLIGLLFIAYVVFVPLAIHAGFRVKRAIFEEGVTIANLFDRSRPGIFTVHVWQGFAETNIYHLENRVFEILDVRKPVEFPLDFILTVAPYYILFLALGFTANLIISLLHGNVPPIWEFLGSLAILYAAIDRFRAAREHYLWRKKEKNL